MKISRKKLAIASQTIQDNLDDFENKKLKQRIKYLIKQNKISYELLEEQPEQQYALGDTQEVLRLILKSL